MTNESKVRLRSFADDVYLHQVIARTSDGVLHRSTDLPIALAQDNPAEEWRIHFHVPLYAEVSEPLGPPSMTR